MLAMKETLILIVDGVDELLERKREQLFTELRGLMEATRPNDSSSNGRGPRLKMPNFIQTDYQRLGLRILGNLKS